MGERFEWRTLDWRTQVRAELGQAGPDSRILIIGIGDRSTINIEPWPFRRAYHAQLQQLVAFNQPAVLTWDIIFQNRVDRDGVPWDGDSDSDFSTTTSALVEQGVPIVFAAVSAADPTGDDANLLGITWPIDQIEGDWENLAGDEFLTLPFPGIRGNGYFGTVDAPRGPEESCGICRCWCAWANGYSLRSPCNHGSFCAFLRPIKCGGVVGTQ